jgi:queuine tRNA-ribosyltransferase
VTLRNARHADDPRPLDAESSCSAARDYSRAYLHHLVKAGEILGMMLLTQANVAYYQELMGALRAAIAAGCLSDFIAETRARWIEGERASP